jgi:WD40 repeat protein
LFAIGSSDGSVEVRDFKGKLVNRWKAHDGAVLGLAISQDGRT